MKVLFWDTENSPMLSYHWGRWQQNISPIQTLEEARILCFGAKWLGGGYIFKAAYETGVQDMLETISALLTEADVVVSWNGVRHDSKKIRTEFLLEGMDPPAPWRDKDVDLMRAVKAQFSFSSNSLDHVSKQLGVGEKVKHEGFFDIIPKVMAGDPKARAAFAKYQKQDVLLLEKLYEKLLPWIPVHPNVALINNIADGCPRCGSTKLERRGFRRTTASTFQRYQCENGHWSSGAHRLATTALRPTA